MAEGWARCRSTSWSTSTSTTSSRESAFYVDALGLRVGRRFGESVVELLGGPAPIYLLAKKDGTLPFGGATAPRDYRRHWTPVHLDFVVADVDAAVERAVAAGAHLEGEIA